MAFIQASTTTNKDLVKIAPIGGSDVNLAIPTSNANITSVENFSGSTALTGALSKTDALTSITNEATKASNYLRSAIASTLSTFDKKADSLASSISGRLAGLFKDKNIASASTVNTKISDPVANNLINKKPAATAFIVSDIAAGSQAANSGKTTVGSGAAQMKGTSLLTLVNRFKTDITAVKNIPGTIAGRLSTQRLNGLFGKATAGALGSKQVGSTLSTVSSVVSVATKSGLTKTLGLTGSSSQTARSSDLTEFLSVSGPASAAFGNLDFTPYYQTNKDHSITDASGNIINTNKSGVDSNTANAILSLLSRIGCSVTTNEYMSANQAESLFGLSLLLAALEGMTDLVNDLLNCRYANTPLGQNSLNRAFAQVSGSQLSVAGSILNSIDAPQTINSYDLNVGIITNPILSASDKAAVESVLGKMGTSTMDVVTLPGVSSSKYPVYDGSIIPKMNPSFTNAVFQDTAVTDYFASRSVGVGKDGKLTYI